MSAPSEQPRSATVSLISLEGSPSTSSSNSSHDVTTNALSRKRAPEYSEQDQHVEKREKISSPCTGTFLAKENISIHLVINPHSRAIFSPEYL